MHLSKTELESLLTEVPGPTLAHLLVCLGCRDKVAGIFQADVLLPEPIGSRPLERVLSRALSAAEDRPSEQELLLGYELSSLLLALPREGQLQAAAQKREFHSPSLAEVLLLTAAEREEEPELTRHLASLAEIVLDHLPDSTRNRELRTKSALLLAKAARLQGLLDLAEDFLADVRHNLRDHPLDHPLRISLCLERAHLSQDRRSPDEAIALFERAIQLAFHLRLDDQLTEARLALGWLYLKEEELESAIVPLRQAQELLAQERSERALSCWEALALVAVELGDDQQVEELLGKAEVLAEREDVDPLHALRMRARVEAHGPRSRGALALFTSVFEQRLSRGQSGTQAVLAGLELAIHVIEVQEPASAGPILESVFHRLEALEPDRLVSHILPVLRFAFGLGVARKGAFLDALLSARWWVERAHLNPKLPYHPLLEPEQVISWDKLTLEQRFLLADQALPPELASRLRSHPGSTGFFILLSRGQFELLTWLHEALTGARILLPDVLMEDTYVD